MMQDPENSTQLDSASQRMFPIFDPTATALSTQLPITHEQLIANQARMRIALMAARLPVSLHATLAATSPPIYAQDFFSNWMPRLASSPPSPLHAVPEVSPPAPNTKPASRRNNNNNNSHNNNNNNDNSDNNNMTGNDDDRIVRRGRAAKRKAVKAEVAADRISPVSPPETAKDGKDKVFTCGVCQRSFGYKHVLQNHERTHTGEKPFQCRECQKRFTRDHHLKTHMRLHTGEKPYKCKYCERKFVQVANLRRHLRVHTGERPYACEVCSSRFSDSNQLKAHMLIHNDEKPFRCSTCQMRFRRRHHLQQHKCGNGAAQMESPPTEAESPPSLNSDEVDSEEYVDVDADGEQAPGEEPEGGIARKYIAEMHQPISRLATHHLRINPELNGPVYPAATMTLNPSPVAVLPVQTEPEDLSMNKSSSRRSHSGGSNNSSLNADVSNETNPEEDDDEEDEATMFLRRSRAHRRRAATDSDHAS